MRYRVTVEVERENRRPDHRSDFPRFFVRKFWQTDFTVEGDADIVATALRAVVERIESEVRAKR